MCTVYHFTPDAGFRLFATISKANLSSIASSKAVNSIQIIEELPGDYIYERIYKTKTLTYDKISI